MRLENFPIATSLIREHLQKLKLWPIPNSMNGKLFLADIKASYQKAILACHPDSRETTSHCSELPAVNDVVDAYKQLSACFSKVSGDRQEMYIHHKSLIEAGRFSAIIGKRNFRDKRFAHLRNEWNDFLGGDIGDRKSSQGKAYHKSQYHGSFKQDGHYYDVRELNRFVRPRKSPSVNSVGAKKTSGTSQPPKNTSSSTDNEDAGVWYSKDFFRSDQRASSLKK